MERIDHFSVAMGAAIRGAIASSGFSQSELAVKVPMGINTLSRRINGSLPFTWPEIMRIAHLTDTPVEVIVEDAKRRSALHERVSAAAS